MRFDSLPFLVLVFLLSGVNLAQAGPAKSVKQWNAYCSDVLDCGFSSAAESAVVNSLEFQRDAKANAPVNIRIYVAKPLVENAKLSVSVPGALDNFMLFFKDGVEEDGYFRFVDARIENELLPALRKGSSMLVSVETQEPTSAIEIDLSGVTAIMLFLDEVQNRLNKTDALVQKGLEAAVGIVARAVELESSADLPQTVRDAWRNHPDQCSIGYDNEDLIAKFGGIEISWDLNAKVKHYVVPCGGPGAYNLAYAAFLFDQETGQVRSLSFPVMSPKGPTVYNLIINMSWDEQTSQLSAYAKGRGLGDCGTSSIWEWDDTGIYGNFILIEQRSKEDCDGVYDDWPLVWPLK